MRDGGDGAQRGFPLSPPGDLLGVSCDAEGPSLGPLRLLQKTAAGFEPRPKFELDVVLSMVYGRPFSSERLIEGLKAVARALDQGEMARALFSTQHLRLQPLQPHEAQRALVLLQKASDEDEKHPGWPKGTPDSKGGQFRPKTGIAADPVRTEAAEPARNRAVHDMEKAIARRNVRTLIKSYFSPRRLLRLTGEVLAAPIPGADAVDIVLLMKDIYDAAKEYSDLVAEAKTAVDFMNKGPYSLDDLRAGPGNSSFASFDEFKKTGLRTESPPEKTWIEKFAGPAGDGYEWHHIVEQGPNGPRMDPTDLQSTRNIIKLPKAVHAMVTSRYASTEAGTTATVRSRAASQTFEEQTQMGIKHLQDLGVLRSSP